MRLLACTQSFGGLSIGKSGLGDAKAVFWNRASEKMNLVTRKRCSGIALVKKVDLVTREKNMQPSEQALYK